MTRKCICGCMEAAYVFRDFKFACMRNSIMNNSDWNDKL